MTFIAYTNCRLVLRGVLLLWGIVSCVENGERIDLLLRGELWEFDLFLAVTWAVLLFSVLARFFPSRVESLGAQKEHESRYVPRRGMERNQLLRERRKGNGDAIRALLFWLLLNGGVYALYFMKKITENGLLLVSLFYSLSDVICIRFFCPFQRWLMSNRCCTTCRIYNWDHMMIHTPTLLIPNPMAIPLWLGSALLVLRWEWRWLRHLERFVEAGNQALSCAACPHPKSCQSCVRKKKRLFMKK